jgi:hypothetical protein
MIPQLNKKDQPQQVYSPVERLESKVHGAGSRAIDLENSMSAKEGGMVAEKSSAPQQASFLRWLKTSFKRFTDPARARSSDKLVVSLAGEAYDATENQLN